MLTLAEYQAHNDRVTEASLVTFTMFAMLMCGVTVYNEGQGVRDVYRG